MTVQKTADEQRLTAFLDELTNKLESDPKGALKLLDDADPSLTTAPEVTLTRVQLLASTGRPKEALSLCSELVSEHPDDADFVYALGMTHQLLEDEEAATTAWLRAYDLETPEKLFEGLDREELEEFVLDVVDQVIQELPASFKGDLAQIPVLIEDRPQRDMVAEGFDPRALGLFEGASSEELKGGEVVSAPTRIVVYVANLLSVAHDEDTLAEQIAVTLYHEIGHYYGLEEEDMERLGLE